MLPVRVDQLRQASVQDSLLSRVLNYIVNGWPSSVDPELRPYFQRQDQLTMEAGCILCGIRVVIPSKLCKQALGELHTSHPGIVRMKSLAYPTCGGQVLIQRLNCLCATVQFAKVFGTASHPLPYTPGHGQTDHGNGFILTSRAPFLGICIC